MMPSFLFGLFRTQAAMQAQIIALRQAEVMTVAQLQFKIPFPDL